MEEDKILIAFRNYNKFYKEENGKLLIAIDLDIKTELDKAIENLLTRYKEKKERIRHLELKIVSQKEHMRLLETHRLRKYVMSKYIEKSKIKEKIEELKEIADEDNLDEFIKIRALKELLEEE